MTPQETPSEEERETYALVSSALGHPIRRRILRMLAEKPQSFTEIQNVLNINSAHLSYHLGALRELLNQTKDGRYFLSGFGEATLSLMHRVEETEEMTPKRRRYDTRNLWFALFVITLFLIGAYLTTPTQYDMRVLSPYDFSYSMEEGDFTGIHYTTKAEVTTPWMDLSFEDIYGIRRASTVDINWICAGRYPIRYPGGTYILFMTYRIEVEPNLYRTVEERLGTYHFDESAGAPTIYYPNLELPQAFRDEYGFKLMFYTNSTIQRDVVPARLVLELRYPVVGTYIISQTTVQDSGWHTRYIPLNAGHIVLALGAFLLIAKLAYPKTRKLLKGLKSRVQKATKWRKLFLALFTLLLITGSFHITPIINQYLDHYLNPPSFFYSARKVSDGNDREVLMSIGVTWGGSSTWKDAQPCVFKARVAAPMEYKNKLDQISITFTTLLLTDWESSDVLVVYNETRTVLEWCQNPPTARIMPQGQYTFLHRTFTVDNRADISIPCMVEWGFEKWSWGLLPHETTTGRSHFAISLTLLAFGSVGLTLTLHRIKPKEERPAKISALLYRKDS